MGYATGMVVLTLVLLIAIFGYGIHVKQSEHLQLVVAQQEMNQFEVLKDYSFRKIDTLLQYKAAVHGSFRYNGGVTRYFSSTNKAVVRITLSTLSMTFEASIDTVNGKRKLTNIWPIRQ